jgi:hypothetical protein
MDKLQHQFKIIRQNVNHSICGLHELPIMYANKPEEMLLEPNHFLLFRISHLDLASSLVFKLKYLDNLNPNLAQLEIYITLNSHNPTKTNYDYKFLNPLRFTICAEPAKEDDPSA